MIKRESDFVQKLSILIKLYTNEAKYNDDNDSFLFKLITFHDMCDRVDVSHSIKLKACLTMVKELALNCYYSNMSTNVNAFATFNEVCFQMKSYFEDVEYKKSILFK